MSVTMPEAPTTPLSDMPDINNVLDYNPEDVAATGWFSCYHSAGDSSGIPGRSQDFLKGVSWEKARDYLISDTTPSSLGAKPYRDNGGRWLAIYYQLMNATPNQPVHLVYETTSLKMNNINVIIDTMENFRSNLGRTSSEEGPWIQSGYPNWDTQEVGFAFEGNWGYEVWEKIAAFMRTQPTLEQFEMWVLENIIGPYNAERQTEAHEWNAIPEHDRLDYSWESLKEQHPQSAGIVDALGFGGGDVSDVDLNDTIIDVNRVDWDLLYKYALEDFGQRTANSPGADSWTTPSNTHTNMADPTGNADGLDPTQAPAPRIPCYCDVGLTTPHEWTGSCENGTRPTMRYEAATPGRVVHLTWDDLPAEHQNWLQGMNERGITYATPDWQPIDARTPAMHYPDENLLVVGQPGWTHGDIDEALRARGEDRGWGIEHAWHAGDPSLDVPPRWNVQEDSTFRRYFEPDADDLAEGTSLVPQRDQYLEQVWPLLQQAQPGPLYRGTNLVRTASHVAAIGSNWVYIEGQVGFGRHWFQIAQEMLMNLGADEETNSYVTNMLARNTLPTDMDIAIGSTRNGRVQIWESTVDRNAVWDAVSQAKAQQLNQ